MPTRHANAFGEISVSKPREQIRNIQIQERDSRTNRLMNADVLTESTDARLYRGPLARHRLQAQPFCCAAPSADPTRAPCWPHHPGSSPIPGVVLHNRLSLNSAWLPLSDSVPLPPLSWCLGSGGWGQLMCPGPPGRQSEARTTMCSVRCSLPKLSRSADVHG